MDSPDEIKPYVAVGPSKDLSITVHKETFDSGFIAFCVLFGIGLLVVVGILAYTAYQKNTLPPPPPPLKSNPNAIKQSILHTNIGAASYPTSPIKKHGDLPGDGSSLLSKQVCELVPHTLWVDDHCECQPPFFGPTCSQERHNAKYFAVGTPLRDAVNIDVLRQSYVTGKSFAKDQTIGSQPKDTCSDQCSKDPLCIGFLYHNQDEKQGLCTLLKDNVIVNSRRSIAYSYDQESTLYLRSSENLHFEDRIFLEGITGSIPPRFWLTKEAPEYLQLDPYEITKLNFAPRYTKIYGSSHRIEGQPQPYTGIYCRHNFTLDDVEILLQRGNTSECYIHHADRDINLPLDWKYQIHERPLYVVYV